jgi:hypothetical protein
MKSTIFMTAIIIILPVFASAKEPAAEATADTIQVLKISPQDGRAVIKTPDGKMEIIKAGDVLRIDDRTVSSSGLRVKSEEKQKPVAGSEVRVVEIAEGRVVLEEKKGVETETVIIRLEEETGSGLREQKIAPSSELRVVGKETRKTTAPKQRIERIRKTGEKRPELLAPQATQEKKGDMPSSLKGRKSGFN